uniref:NAD(P)-binding domain-containing protein n=1 Tax=Octactis speculum TaxID=3111310 RepID=A0A7S2CHB4_9STRA
MAFGTNAFRAPISMASSRKIVAVGSTGPLGRKFVEKLAGQGDDVLVLARNAYLASTPYRVSHDYGYIGETLASDPKVNLRYWDGGDLLDVVGDEWVGWQDSIRGYDVMVNMVGAISNVREGAINRLVEAIIAMPEKDRPRAVLNVLPAPEILLDPGMRRRMESTAESALRLAPYTQVTNLRLGRVLSLDTDAQEATRYKAMYYGVTEGISRVPCRPWVHVDDALNAVDQAISGALGLSGACEFTVDASAPANELTAAGFVFQSPSYPPPSN